MPSAISQNLYDAYGKFYDHFEGLFRRRLAKALSRVPFRPGDVALDIGVGTGLSLVHYPVEVDVVGIDLSESMLAQAKAKVERGEVRAGASTKLLRANALQLPFADESFEVVFMSHVLSTVPDPNRCLAEALRVTREYGHLVIVNHFLSRIPAVRLVEKAMDPICRRCGWRNDLDLEQLLKPVGVEMPRKKSWNLFPTVYLRKEPKGVRWVEFGPAEEGLGKPVRA